MSKKYRIEERTHSYTGDTIGWAVIDYTGNTTWTETIRRKTREQLTQAIDNYKERGYEIVSTGLSGIEFRPYQAIMAISNECEVKVFKRYTDAKEYAKSL